MKSFVFAIVASIAFAVVFAAPYSFPEFDEPEIDDPVKLSAVYEESPEIFEFERHHNNLTITWQCLSAAFRQVAQQNNLSQLWEYTARNLRAAGERLRNCKNQSNPEVVRRCVRKEVQIIRSIYSNFLRTLFASDELNILAKLRREIVHQCGTPSPGPSEELEPEIRLIEEPEPIPLENSYLDYLKCLWNVVNRVVSESSEEVKNIWNNAKDELTEVIQQLKQCKKLPEGEVASCVRRQTQASLRILGQFIRNLIKEGFGGVLGEIEQEVGKECRNQDSLKVFEDFVGY